MHHNGTIPHCIIVPDAIVDLIQRKNAFAVSQKQFQYLEFGIGQRNREVGGQAVLGKTTNPDNSLAHRTTWLRSDLCYRRSDPEKKCVCG